MRIGYVQFPQFATIFLVTMFQKKDEANLSQADQRAIKSWIAQVKIDLARGVRS